MQEERYDGSVKFSELFEKRNFSVKDQIMQAVENPDNKTITIHKDGSRTIFGDSVYEFKKGKRSRIGYSWQNTTETIVEHEKDIKRLLKSLKEIM